MDVLSIVLLSVVGYIASGLLNAWLMGRLEIYMGSTYGAWVLLVFFGPIGTFIAGIFYMCWLGSLLAEKATNPWVYLYNKGKRL